jgi:hypothetical protein
LKQLKLPQTSKLKLLNVNAAVIAKTANAKIATAKNVRKAVNNGK